VYRPDNLSRVKEDVDIGTLIVHHRYRVGGGVLLGQRDPGDPAAAGGVVERLGKFKRTLGAGPHLVVPIVDKVRYNLDMRENVVPFPPQGVITRTT
jgi:hypothetical protein